MGSAEKQEDPDERFMRVLSYYLAGWHIKPRGVKKPCVHVNIQTTIITNSEMKI